MKLVEFHKLPMSVLVRTQRPLILSSPALYNAAVGKLRRIALRLNFAVLTPLTPSYVHWFWATFTWRSRFEISPYGMDAEACLEEFDPIM